jgi:hypothetical protein
MRVGARLAGAKLILLPSISTTSRDAAFFWLPTTCSTTLSGSAGVENESGANCGHGKEAHKIR